MSNAKRESIMFIIGVVLVFISGIALITKPANNHKENLAKEQPQQYAEKEIKMCAVYVYKGDSVFVYNNIPEYALQQNEGAICWNLNGKHMTHHGKYYINCKRGTTK